jgi:putative nucleotidyltransferase with HDIG domain
MINVTSENRSEFPLSIKIPDFVGFILERLGKRGFSAYIVGGAIRDELIGRRAIDWDIATDALPFEIKSVFRDINHFALKHETVTLVDSATEYEVTSMRGNRGEKADILSDLARRDFTLNAMAYDALKSTVLDPFYGASDIKEKRIRAVIDPAERFKEDPLRMLRAVRLAGELDFEIDKHTLDAIPPLSPLIKQVSNERIRDELVRLLMCTKPSGLLEMLRRSGLLECIIPELIEGYSMGQNLCHSFTVFEHILYTVDNAPSDKMLRVAALFHDIGKPRVMDKMEGKIRFYNHEAVSAKMAEEIMERLRFSRDEIRRVAGLVQNHMINYSLSWTDAAIRRLIRRAGRENIMGLIALRRADIIAHGKDDDKLSLVNHLEERINMMKDNTATSMTDLAMDGRKVMAILGIDQCQRVGEALEMLLDIIIEDPEMNTEERLAEKLIEIRDRM